jgi:adenosylhomocysteine nucleosidase
MAPSKTLSVTAKHHFSIDTILFVFALEIEAATVFENYNILFTGIGKVNATYELTKAIAAQRPDLIINLGSAGSNHFNKGDVVCCTEFVQRDMDVRGLGYELYQTPFATVPIVFSHGLTIEEVKKGICGTGDSFEMSQTDAIYNLVDMEAYALATVAHKEEIPFLCIKYISDGADDNAADDWIESVHKAAVSFAEILQL